jgi:hypothetical protein
MKKKILGGIAILAIAAVAAFNVGFNSQSDGLSDVYLANVEALAQESGSTKDCWNNISAAVAQQVLYCGTCTYIPGTPGVFAGLKKC